MSRRVLIVGDGDGAARLAEKARSLGLIPVVVDVSVGAPRGASGEGNEVAPLGYGPTAVEQVAREQGVRGIYCGVEPALEEAAKAAAALGLPGLSPHTARCIRRKEAMREALTRAGISNLPYRLVRTVVEAEAAAGEVGAPVVVKPCDGARSRGVQRVDHVEDVSLAFLRALKHSPSRAVLVEAFMAGEEYHVVCLAHGGRSRDIALAGVERSGSMAQVLSGFHVPAPVDSCARAEVVNAAVAALRAIGLETGLVCVEVILTSGGPQIVEVGLHLGGEDMPEDLLSLAYGADVLADAIRMAVGNQPVEMPRWERGAALSWIPSHGGIVTEVQGVEDAASVPGVQKVVLAAKPGHVLGHVVDNVARNRVGYVLATGDSAEAAIAAAQRAQGLCRVVTRPAVL